MQRVIRFAFVSGLFLAVVLPFLPVVIWAFSLRWNFPDLVPEWSMRAWTYVSSPSSQVITGLRNSLIVAFFTTLLSLLIGIPAGRAIGLYTFKGKRLVEFFILLPAIIPPMAVVMGIHVMFIRYNLTETFIGVILVHLIPTLPYMVMVLSGIFANYQIEYEYAARSLGATALKTSYLVMLPIILPGVMVGALFAFLISWSQYILTVMIGGGSVVTLPQLLFSFVQSGDNSIAGAISLIFIAPALLMLFFTSRYLSGDSQGIGGLGRL